MAHGRQQQAVQQSAHLSPLMLYLSRIFPLIKHAASTVQKPQVNIPNIGRHVYSQPVRPASSPRVQVDMSGQKSAVQPEKNEVVTKMQHYVGDP